jgi:hypothetical protein
LRCGTQIYYVGTKKFQEGGNKWFGAVGEMFSNREHYDVYVCPRCGRLEMFMEGVGEESRPG